MPKLSSTEAFIEKAKKKHAGKYTYEHAVYSKANNLITITCPLHGDFTQRAANHLNGTGCQECSGLKPLTTEVFITKAKKKHGERYDYSKTEFAKSVVKVIITCKVHGDFEQFPSNHLSGHGCPECSNVKQSNAKGFAEAASKKHDDKYTYDNVIYKNNRTEVTITCPIHGDFKQTPSNHLAGSGCQKCGLIRRDANRRSKLWAEKN